MTAPATEKAAPIPAESFTDRAYEIICEAVGPRHDEWSAFDRAVMDLARDADEALAQDRADRTSQEENPRPAKTGGLETAVLRQPQEERIREKADDTRLSLDVEWEERIREDERDSPANLAKRVLAIREHLRHERADGVDLGTLAVVARTLAALRGGAS